MNDALPSASIPTLQQRAKLLKLLRAFFEEHDYWEVETPLLSRETCVDQWLEPFQMLVNAEVAFLQTSPEFAMKRLLCAGADSIYQVTRSFRQDEVGQLHNPEFSIVEWYRLGLSYHNQMDFVQQLVTELLLSSPDHSHTPLVFKRISYDEAFQQFAGEAVLGLSLPGLIQLGKEFNLVIPENVNRDQALNLLLAEVIEPELKKLPAVFLYDYPASQAALAKVRAEEHPVAERFELYLSGVEICNGYQELTDADELQRRMQHQQQLRTDSGLPQLPVNSRLIEAMRIGLPECSGVALGFDRLAMHCLNKEYISEVIPFPFDRA